MRSLCVAFVLLSLVQGSPTVRSPQGPPPAWSSAHHHGDLEPAEPTGEAMPVEELNPGHYPARRAAVVAQHHLNTQHGSPYRWLLLERVLSATLEEVAGMGMKYNVEFSVKDAVTDQSVGLCSSEVLFPASGGSEEQTPPHVQSSCENLLNSNTTEEEKALHLQLRGNSSLVSGDYIPDSFGFIAPEMKPFWHLAGVASSFVMLKESNESTLYNMAQVANVTQLESQNDTLMFRYHVLLHEMVSQEIIHWKLLVSWCPAEGVKVLSAEWQPKCQHCVVPLPKTTQTPPDTSPTPP